MADAENCPVDGDSGQPKYLAGRVGIGEFMIIRPWATEFSLEAELGV